MPTLLQDQWSKRVGAARIRMEGRTAVEAGERVSDVRQAARACDASGSPAAALRVSSEARATEEAQRYRSWQLNACQQRRGGLVASGRQQQHGAARSSFHSANKCEQLHWSDTPLRCSGHPSVPGMQVVRVCFCRKWSCEAVHTGPQYGYSIVFDVVEQCTTSSNTSGEWP